MESSTARDIRSDVLWTFAVAGKSGDSTDASGVRCQGKLRGRQVLNCLNRKVDRFFHELDRWSAITAWIAIAGAVLIIIIPALLKIMGSPSLR